MVLYLEFYLSCSRMKKNDGIKESTDSQATIDDEDTRGKCQRGDYFQGSNKNLFRLKELFNSMVNYI